MIFVTTGIYVCSHCGYELFSSRSKFEHSTPWPAFAETLRSDSVAKHKQGPMTYKVIIVLKLLCTLNLYLVKLGNIIFNFAHTV